MSNKMFIQVSDKETYEKLIKLGFQEVGMQEHTHLFLNDKTFKFSDEFDINKIKYTNNLFI